MIKKYIIFCPSYQGTPEEEWKSCLGQIRNATSTSDKLVKLNIFIDVPDYKEFVRLSHIIGKSVSETFGEDCPAYTVTVHPPERPLKVVVEAGYVDIRSCKVTTRFRNSIPYVVMESDKEKEVWAGGMASGLFCDDTRKAAKAAFDQMRAILEAEHMSFNDIVRQWNYIGDILQVKNELQNYQVFNEVRSETYHKFRTIHSYPAATGIGLKFGGVILDFCAVKSENNLKIIAIDNPDQIRPYDYGQQVLKGKTTDGKGIKQPPQFERAVLLNNNQGSTLFVSGTASIIGQDTIGIDDVEKQTVVTIENISRLTDEKRIGHLTGNSVPDTGRMILLRVYIKYQKDFRKVKAICEDYFPGVPAVYIEADVCRDNLLVEIEAEFSKTN
jgi:enamine deaminase RidA (YjgF/YER057c/UK114 family)